MTNQNDYTDQPLTALFDVMDLSCLYAARFSLFAPGILMASRQMQPAQAQSTARQTRTNELADALGDF